jgi:hypothetical protein
MRLSSNPAQSPFRRRRWRLACGVIVSLLAGLASPAIAAADGTAPVIDQRAESPGELYRFQLDMGSVNYHGLAQTVTVGADGQLVAVDLFLAREQWTTYPLNVEIRGGTPAGRVLATSSPLGPETVPAVEWPCGHEYWCSPAGGDWVHVTFPSPASVRVGQVVSITTAIPDPLPGGEPAGPAWYWAWSDAGSPSADDYPGGVAWGRGWSSWGSWWDGSDLAFRSWVVPGTPGPGDTTPPVMSLPDNMTVTSPYVWFEASAIDAVDGVVPVQCTPQPGSLFPVGSTTVQCYAADYDGNTSRGSFTVLVQDLTPPSLWVEGDKVVAATGPDGATVEFWASAYDDFDGFLPIQCTPPSGSLFPLGATTVQCTATDTTGNTARAALTITVKKDLIPPVLTLPVYLSIDAVGPGGAPVTYTASAMDAYDGEVPVQCTPPSGSLFAMGSTTVQCTATDSEGNTSNGSFTVAVRDSTGPVITVPAPIVVNPTGPTGAVVTYSATAVDAVDGSVAVTCSPASGSMFRVGTTTVTCRANDRSWNYAWAYFTVQVKDVTAPVLNLPIEVYADAVGPAGATVVYSVSATDATDGSVPITCSPASGSLFPIGETTVHCTATDRAGNSASGTFLVFVKGADWQLVDLGTMANIYAGPGSSLGDKVTTAQRLLAAGKISQVCETLLMWDRTVTAQSGKTLTAGEVADLLDRSRRIRAVLGC